MIDPFAAPLATYRIQFNKDFRFEDAARIAPYLARLGISHVYASPYLKARAGSNHGYDITDHNAFNPEIGDEAAFVAFSDSLTRLGMGQILDFVPNHMGIGRADNDWWLDVLEWGEDSPFAAYFDIDWDPAKPELVGKVLLPVLGDHYGRVLEAGDLTLKFDPAEGSFSVWYYENRFPVRVGDYESILRPVLVELRRRGAATEVVVAVEDLAADFRDVRDWSQSRRHWSNWRAEAEALKRRLGDLARAEADLRAAIEATAERIGGNADDAESRQPLHEVLERQHYRLAHWRVAAEEINYRRFFQINELAGIRIELPAVFEATHRLVLDLIRQRRVHGLRIDHIDGLFDPKTYLHRLQARALEVLRNGGGAGEGEGDGGGAAPSFYVVVEKILAGHERLREDWPIAGTTGYDFLNRVNGLFLDPAGEAQLRRTFERFTGQTMPFDEVAYDSKRQVMDFELASELRVLANEFNKLTETSWLTRDHTLVGLRQAMREIVACFPVYRTYVDELGSTASDRRDIDWAIVHARRRSLRADKSVFDFIQAVLTTDLTDTSHAYSRREVRRLAMKFQQYTGPVAAKGVEDTAFYRFNRLVSLNEVGGEPTRFGTSVAAFHKTTQDAGRRWPQAMLATATHDTKRGEDARVRIDALSEMPLEWARRVRRWATFNHRRKNVVNDEPAPTSNDEYLFYQALVGSWPVEFHDSGDLEPEAVDAFRERIGAYMIKAVREAKTHSSWIDPDSDYESALLALVARTLDVSRPNPLLADFREFHRTLATLGVVNSLSQAAIKFTAPGIPDVYQGCELWDLSLVDPDNRRPVDFAARERRLGEIVRIHAERGGAIAAELLDEWTDGRVKLFVVWRLLTLRRRFPTLFGGSGYAPVETTGQGADSICAFLRSDGDARVLVVAPRLVRKRMGRQPTAAWPVGDAIWGDTTLLLPQGVNGGAWRCVFTDRTSTASNGDADRLQLRLADILADFPISALVEEPSAAPC